MSHPATRVSHEPFSVQALLRKSASPGRSVTDLTEKGYSFYRMDVYRAHQIARERGTIPIVYWIVRGILQPFFTVYFRLRRIGLEHVPAEGPVLLASNHRSFSDPFMIGMCLRRPLRFVAKVELFDNRWKAWLLLALGAFPIRRGEADDDAMETARLILEQGGAVGIFPEGTRVRPGPLGEPKRGVGRLSLETGAPIVPVAIIGTEDIRRGWRIRPRRVTVRCGRALTFPRPLDREPRHALAQEIANRVWSCVSLQWEWLGGLPPVRHAIVVGAGSWGTAVATLLARGGAAVQLVCRTPEQGRGLAALRTNLAYLPGVTLPQGVRVTMPDALDWHEVDVVCMAVPSSALPEALESIEPRIPDGIGVLVLSKGLIAPSGEAPSAHVAERLGERPVACLGGPAHALEAVERGAGVTVASTDRRYAALLAGAFRRGGVACDTSTDIIGVELAGAAKNAAALAAGAALGAGANAAGLAAGRIFAECQALATARGARPESFAGPAGAGDLVATVLASHSRNRRAGELVAEGLEPERIPEMLGQVPEALSVVPVLARAMHDAGLKCPATDGLADLVEGRLAVEIWVESARRAPARSRAA
jgi:glycerol-3-phosphate dehydrogenase (NAD(P)+)